MTVTQERARYVFAVGREGAGLPEAASGLYGPGGSAVRTVHGAGLGALVADVPAGRYDEQGLKAQLEDLESLEALARAHDAVVAAAYRHATVLPMRLATVYRDDAGVTAMLAERREEFDGMLARLEGRVEWGVKVYADPGEAGAAAQPAGRVPAEGPGASPGRAYLQRRRTERRAHRDVHRAAGAVAERAAVVAGELAAARVSHRLQQGELAGRPGENVANDAYLVAERDAEAFRTSLAALSDEVPGVRVELTGPWAPYSFATPAPAGDRTGGGDGG